MLFPFTGGRLQITLSATTRQPNNPPGRRLNCLIVLSGTSINDSPAYLASCSAATLAEGNLYGLRWLLARRCCTCCIARSGVRVYRAAISTCTYVCSLPRTKSQAGIRLFRTMHGHSRTRRQSFDSVASHRAVRYWLCLLIMGLFRTETSSLPPATLGRGRLAPGAT